MHVLMTHGFITTFFYHCVAKKNNLGVIRKIYYSIVISPSLCVTAYIVEVLMITKRYVLSFIILFLTFHTLHVQQGFLPNEEVCKH